MSNLKFIGDRFVSQSYQNLVHLSASALLDGTGSVIDNIKVRGVLGSRISSGSSLEISGSSGMYQLAVLDDSENLSFGLSGRNILVFGDKQELPDPTTGSVVRVGEDLYLGVDITRSF